MEIKNIKIKNIRSYTDEEIDFPKGTTLLSGNIGTGKSTILLAIEFALFGITKELPGSALLRNGTKKGSVELNFNIQDKDITIKRTLKKGTSITQDTGSIAINGAKKDASATELKQNILTLLNYPQELLTKTKSLIYRYTVYTPQEEMKNILTGNKEYKIDTLRKVFGIDKYKLLRENAETFISKIKTKNKEFAISIADLENKKDEAIIIGTKIKNSKLKLNDFLPTLEKIKENIKENKKNIEIFENKIKEIQNIKNNINIITTKIDHKLQENKNNKDRLLQLKENIKLTEEEIKKEQPQTIEEKTLLNKEKELLALEKELKNLSNKAQDLKTSKKHIEKIIEDISKLDFCPLCKQNVGKDHIHKVKTEESKKITKYTEELEKTLVEEENKESIIKSLKEYIENLKKEQQKANLLNIKITNLEEKKKELIKIKECEIEIKKEIGSLNTEKLASLNQIKNNEEIENKFKKIKEDLEELNKKERQLEIEKATLGK